MSKKTKWFGFLMSLLMVLSVFAGAGTSAYAAETTAYNSDEVESIKYFFENVVVRSTNENDSTINYVVNEENLNSLGLSSDEKEGVRNFAQFMNVGLNEDIRNKRSVDTVKACIADAAGIAKGSLNVLDGMIKKGNWLGVIGALGSMKLLFTKPGAALAIGVFVATCGAKIAE